MRMQKHRRPPWSAARALIYAEIGPKGRAPLASSSTPEQQIIDFVGSSRHHTRSSSSSVILSGYAVRNTCEVCNNTAACTTPAIAQRRITVLREYDASSITSYF